MNEQTIAKGLSLQKRLAKATVNLIDESKWTDDLAHERLQILLRLAYHQCRRIYDLEYPEDIPDCLTKSDWPYDVMGKITEAYTKVCAFNKQGLSRVRRLDGSVSIKEV